MDIVTQLQEKADRLNEIADKSNEPLTKSALINLANDLDYMATMITIGSFELSISKDVFVQPKYTI